MFFTHLKGSAQKDKTHTFFIEWRTCRSNLGLRIMGRKGMKKGFIYKAVRVVVVIALAIIVSMLLITLRPKAKRVVREETGRLVEVLTAKAEDVNMIIEAYGTVKPREMLRLVAEVKGQIVQLHPSFKEGGFIPKGAVLVKIDPRSYQLEVDRRKVQIRQAEADLKHLKQEIKNLEIRIDIAASDANLAKNEFFRLKKLLGKKKRFS